MRISNSFIRSAKRVAPTAISATAVACLALLPAAAGTNAANALRRIAALPAPKAHGIEGETSVAGGAGLFGSSNATTGIGYGVYGYSARGSGIYGISDSNAFPSVYGESTTIAGIAMYGKAEGIGVLGGSAQSNGIVGYTTAVGTLPYGYGGVVGVDKSSSADATGPNFGVVGLSPGIAVGGLTTGGYGVYGVADAGIGVSGYSRTNVGVYGVTAGEANNAWGVFGVDFANVARRSAGVTALSFNGAGVYAFGDQGYGVFAQGIDGPGVYAESGSGDGISGTNNQGGSGVVGYGGRASAGESGFSNGVLAVGNNSGATALAIDAVNGTPISVVAGASATKILSLDAAGDLTISGTLTQGSAPASVARDPQGVGHVVYSPQQTVATIEDVGGGQMIAGRAYVRIDSAFARLLDRRQPYRVFITPDGPTVNPLYVAEKSSQGFEVREASNRATVAFDYRIVGYPQSAGDSRAVTIRPRLAVYRDLETAPSEKAALAHELATHAASLDRFGSPGRDGKLARPRLPMVRGKALDANPLRVNVGGMPAL